MEGKRIPLIVIAGPTASGKSEAAVELARRIGGEVISADSMQVYRHMDIGSAKITLEEMMGVPHHMIDVTEPNDPMDVARYAELAKNCIREIVSRGKIPILAGGTGFYIQAVTRDIDFEDTSPDTALREELLRFAEEHGAKALHARLYEVDPKAAEEIHPNNVKRVIRALEYFEERKSPISSHNASEMEKESPYELCFFVIHEDRSVLYERINHRVDVMMEMGLYEEVQYLKAMGLTRSDVSMQGLGYKEMLDVMDGTLSLEEAVALIKRDSRRYAKRQITWFKREKDAIWLDRADFGGDTLAIVDRMYQVIKEKGIIGKDHE